MSIGKIVRRLAGRRLFAVLGRIYRAIFVDLDKVAQCLSKEIPARAFILDVGGGDGEPINHLFALRADVRVEMIDLAPEVGSMILPQFAARIKRYPATAIDAYLAREGAVPDVLMLLDVVHHIAPALREAVFTEIGRAFERNPALSLIVKDIEPGSPRARLSYLADTYITGDRNVVLIGQRELEALVMRTIAGLVVTSTPLHDVDAPNYMVVFRKAAVASGA